MHEIESAYFMDRYVENNRYFPWTEREREREREREKVMKRHHLKSCYV